MTERDREAGASGRQPTGVEEWPAGWESQQAATQQACLAATPAERLEWLEEVIEIAWASGALPREGSPRESE